MSSNREKLVELYRRLDEIQKETTEIHDQFEEYAVSCDNCNDPSAHYRSLTDPQRFLCDLCDEEDFDKYFNGGM